MDASSAGTAAELLENKWTLKKWAGPEQFEDPTGELMMLPSDMALLWDKGFRTHVERYAADQDAFFTDFAKVRVRLYPRRRTSLKCFAHECAHSTPRALHMASPGVQEADGAGRAQVHEEGLVPVLVIIATSRPNSYPDTA